jgi:hypothetical protein
MRAAATDDDFHYPRPPVIMDRSSFVEKVNDNRTWILANAHLVAGHATKLDELKKTYPSLLELFSVSDQDATQELYKALGYIDTDSAPWWTNLHQILGMLPTVHEQYRTLASSDMNPTEKQLRLLSRLVFCGQVHCLCISVVSAANKAFEDNIAPRALADYWATSVKQINEQFAFLPPIVQVKPSP